MLTAWLPGAVAVAVLLGIGNALLLVVVLHRLPRPGRRPAYRPRPSGPRRDRPAPAHPVHDGATSLDLHGHVPQQRVGRVPDRSPTLYAPGRWPS